MCGRRPYCSEFFVPIAEWFLAVGEAKCLTNPFGQCQPLAFGKPHNSAVFSFFKQDLHSFHTYESGRR